MSRAPRILLRGLAALLASCAAVGGCSVVPAGEASHPAPHEERARRILQRAIEEHGGREAWRHKRDAAFVTTWTHYQDGRRTFTSRYQVKFPIDAGPTRALVEGSESGKQVFMGVSGSQSWFVVGQERYEDLDSLRANRSFVKRAHQLLSLPFRLEDDSLRVSYDGQEVRAGAVADRLRVEHGLEPPALFLFDRQSGRLAGIGSAVADPPTTLVGEFHGYERVEGILVPTIQLFDRIDPITGTRSRALALSVDRVHFRNGFPPGTFEPPPHP